MAIPRGRSFKLALVQMEVEGGNWERNLARASGLIREAAATGAQIALLPEAMDLGWTDTSAAELAGPVPEGPACLGLRAAAKENGIYVCSGLVEKDGNHIYNSAVLIDPDGRVLLRHRKLNELPIGHELYEQGDRLGVCRTELGTIGVMICSDAFAHGSAIMRSLCYMGADILLSPSSWAVPADHDNARDPYGSLWERCYRPVAQEFSVWIAGVSNVGKIASGPWKGRNCIGCSQVIDPSGYQTAFAPYGVDAEALLYADIETVKRPARGCGWDAYWHNRIAHQCP